MQNKFLQFLGLIKKSGQLIEGYNKCEDLIKKNLLFLVIISKDCSQNTREKFVRYSTNYNIPCIEAYSKEELGSPLGRDEISVLGVTNKKMSENLLTLWNEEKNIKSRG